MAAPANPLTSRLPLSMPTSSNSFFPPKKNLVDDKIHARFPPVPFTARHPASRLGGRPQQGGPAASGEMEVWALEAYGVLTPCRKLASPSNPTTCSGPQRMALNAISSRGKPNSPSRGTPESFKG